MEHSHVPLHKWLQAVLLAVSGDRYLSPQKLKEQLELGSYRTTWLLAQRIRDALAQYRRGGREDRGRRAFEASAEYNRASTSNGQPNFDDALKALIAQPPKPPRARPLRRSELSPQCMIDEDPPRRSVRA